MVVVTELVGGCHTQSWVVGRAQAQHCTDGGGGGAQHCTLGGGVGIECSDTRQ